MNSLVEPCANLFRILLVPFHIFHSDFNRGIDAVRYTREVAFCGIQFFQLQDLIKQVLLKISNTFEQRVSYNKFLLLLRV